MGYKIGFYWHIHHGVLVEHCYNVEERRQYIRGKKPAHEVKERLRVFQPVIAQLPPDIIEAGESASLLYRVYITARTKFWELFYNSETSERAAAEAKSNRAEIVWWNSFDGYLNILVRHRELLEELHKKECPDCTWDGHTFLFNRTER